MPRGGGRKDGWRIRGGPGVRPVPGAGVGQLEKEVCVMSMASMPVPVPVVEGSGWRARVQKLGGFLAGMVIPNIAAILAWGLLTAFVIPTGWTPNAKLAELVGPLITFLLPILIGYTGGYLVYGQRGAVVGAIGTAGIAVGSSVPQFIGAMIMGPLGGVVIKEFDNRTKEHVPAGFEMLV